MESLTPEQENNLLANSSQVLRATAEVQIGTLPPIETQGDILPSELGLSDDRLNTSGVRLGIATTAAENLPLLDSGDDAPSQAVEGLDDPHNEEGMNVVIESTEDEQLCLVTEPAAHFNVHPTKIRCIWDLP